MLPTNTDVLIVGAGPTGLALATALQQAGIDHLLIDALPAGLNTSRAAVVHAHTLEMLEPLGIVDRLQAEGLPLKCFTIRDRGEALVRIGFDQLPSAFRHILMLPQPRIEAALADRLESLGGSVNRNVRAIGAWQERDNALVRVETSEGEELVRARILVGADGMHSAIRQSTSIRFDGEAYGEQFVLADVWMDWPLGRDEVSLSFSPAGLVVVAPLPDGSFRVVATMEQAASTPSRGDIQALLDARGPRRPAAVVRDEIWSSRFRVHHRLASSYRDGRILLMGDAAHVHSPAGGQGMNTGLVDAMVLGQALTAVVRDGAPLSMLDRYAEIRRPAAAEVLTLASRLTKAATVRPRLLRWLRNRLLRLLGCSPRIRARLALRLSGISRSHLSFLVTDGETAASPPPPGAASKRELIHA